MRVLFLKIMSYFFFFTKKYKIYIIISLEAWKYYSQLVSFENQIFFENNIEKNELNNFFNLVFIYCFMLLKLRSCEKYFHASNEIIDYI